MDTTFSSGWKLIDKPDSPRSNHLLSVKGELPVLTCEADLHFVNERPFHLLEEFVMRFLVEVRGLERYESLHQQIATVLGLDAEGFVLPVLNRLQDAKAIELDGVGNVTVSERLRQRFDEGVWAEPGKVLSRKLRFLQISPPVQLSSSSVIGRMDETEADVELADLTALQTNFEERFSLHESQRLETVELQSGAWDSVLPVEIEAFDVGEGQWDWEPIDPETREVQPDWKPACVKAGVLEALEAEFDAQFLAAYPEGVEKSPPLKSIEPPKAAKIERFDAVAVRPRLIKEVRAAKQEIVMHYPWIKSGGLDQELINALQDALRRGVRVIITWGIAEAIEQEESHPDVVERLGKARLPQAKGVLLLAWVGNSHVKQAVFDRTLTMEGSQNNLSYRAQPGRKIRRESTNLIDDQAHADAVRYDLLFYLQDRLGEWMSSLRLTNAAEWLRHAKTALSSVVEADEFAANQLLASMPAGMSVSDRVHTATELLVWIQQRIAQGFSAKSWARDCLAQLVPHLEKSKTSPKLIKKQKKFVAALLQIDPQTQLPEELSSLAE